MQKDLAVAKNNNFGLHFVSCSNKIEKRKKQKQSNLLGIFFLVSNSFVGGTKESFDISETGGNSDQNASIKPGSHITVPIVSIEIIV